MYCFNRQLTIAVQVSRTISHTVDLGTPKRWAMVQYSEGVARNHNVIAILHSTEVALCITKR